MSTVHTTHSRIVCHCLGVTESQLQDAVAYGGGESVKDVIDCTGAGSGCTACHRRILGILAGGCESPGETHSPI